MGNHTAHGAALNLDPYLRRPRCLLHFDSSLSPRDATRPVIRLRQIVIGSVHLLRIPLFSTGWAESCSARRDLSSEEKMPPQTASPEAAHARGSRWIPGQQTHLSFQDRALTCILGPLLTPSRDNMSHDSRAWKSASYFFGHPCGQRPKFMLNTFWGGGAFSFSSSCMFIVELHLGQRFLPESHRRMATSFLNWFQLGLCLENALSPMASSPSSPFLPHS